MYVQVGSWIPDTENVEQHQKFEERISKVSLNEGTSNGCDLRNWCSPVENQRVLSSCVANSVVGALELLRIKEGLPHVDLSRLFIYYNSRAQHGSELQDDGTYVRTAYKTLQTLGVCKEETWSYDCNRVLVRPPWKAYREAYGHRIKNFSKVFSEGYERISTIEAALRSGHPVSFGMYIDQKFVDNQDGIVEFDDSFVSLGSHAMLIVGFNRLTKTLIIRNSWGDWGDHGYCYLKYDDLFKTSANDFWIAEGIT